MASLHYLTIQDILWINLQVTKKVHDFDYARLEEAVFYQYAYGDSRSLIPQANRFVNGFQKMRPFDAGNEATALMASLAFLKMNGYDCKLPDRDLAALCSTKFEDIATASADAHHADNLNIREAVREILLENAGILAKAAKVA